jgi:hypothetical protein
LVVAVVVVVVLSSLTIALLTQYPILSHGHFWKRERAELKTEIYGIKIE